jgi:chemotaxis-related protein WspB
MLMLIFYVGKNRYAIESSHVVEVIPRVAYRDVHHMPEYVAGVFNYRGAIVPVIDLCRLIRGTPSRDHLSTRVMMVNYPRPDNTVQCLGLMAEQVMETLDKPEADFMDTGVQTPDSPYLGGMVMDKKGMIQRIHLERLFADVQRTPLLRVGA